MKKAVLISLLSGVLAATLALFLWGCGGASGTEGNGTAIPEKPESVEEGGGRVFTLAELAEFDGKGGKPAYIAVDGVVYDLSGSATWPEGKHTPCNLGAMAGRDLSEELKQAPARMRENLKRFPVVGTLGE